MFASAKFLLRLFLSFSYAFGFVLGLLAALVLLCHFLLTGEGGGVSGLLLVAAVAVGGGSFFGGILTAFLGGWQIQAVWRRGFPLTDETLAVSHRRQLTIERPFAETFTLCA